MKVIRFNVNDGRVYEVPLMVIAENRANFYVEKDADTTFSEEVKFIMEDDYEGIDWLQNNMNLDEIADKAKLIKEGTPVSFEDLDNEDYQIELVDTGDL